MFIPPPIQCSSTISQAFSTHTGKPCVIGLKVKYFSEKDWIKHRFWHVPGWDIPKIWQQAFQWLYQDATSLYYDGSEIEEVKFDYFKLV